MENISRSVIESEEHYRIYYGEVCFLCKRSGKYRNYVCADTLFLNSGRIFSDWYKRSENYELVNGFHDELTENDPGYPGSVIYREADPGSDQEKIFVHKKIAHEIAYCISENFSWMTENINLTRYDEIYTKIQQKHEEIKRLQNEIRDLEDELTLVH